MSANIKSGRLTVRLSTLVASLLTVLSLCATTARADSSALQRATQAHGGAQSQPLEGGTESPTLKTGTDSTMLQTGAESTMLQGGTAGALIQGRAEREGGPTTILFLVDSSLSMKEGLGGKHESKMDAAKDVLVKALRGIPSDCNVGLRVFGQFTGLDPCQATALLVRPGTHNRNSIQEKVAHLKPTGMTPLTVALMNAAERDLPELHGKKTIILISDGQDTCGPDPCAYIQTLAPRGINVKIDIVGLGLRHDRAARNQLDCIAKSSGGKYYDADTAAQLIESVSHSVSKAISGSVITPGTNAGANVKNTETPPELIPILPAGKLLDEEVLQKRESKPENTNSRAPKKSDK